MATTRLYHDDPLLLSFDAEVVAHGTLGGRASVVLDRTAFYPESGGQMADRGTLAGAPVVDVQVDDDGVVHHVLEGALPAIGARATGSIDRARRRTHMALHTAQHMLSRALVDVARAETVSARLGETECTVDVDVPVVAERDLARAEDLVHAVVDDDLAIRAWFPEEGELRALPLRRAPKVTDNVRVVDIGGFDVSPCGGTHCLRTAQVGLVHVTGVERYKGKTRVTFTAGPRARAELVAQDGAVRALARSLTCGPSDLAGAVDKLRRELDASRDASRRLGDRLAESIANELCAAATARGETRVVAVLDEASVDVLRAVGARIAERPDLVALLASRSADGLQVLVARGAKSDFDCGAFLKRTAQAHGGRGGGRPDRAEGRLPPSVDWVSIASRA